jgi:hypothetical protein
MFRGCEFLEERAEFLKFTGMSFDFKGLNI